MVGTFHKYSNYIHFFYFIDKKLYISKILNKNHIIFLTLNSEKNRVFSEILSTIFFFQSFSSYYTTRKLLNKN